MTALALATTLSWLAEEVSGESAGIREEVAGKS